MYCPKCGKEQLSEHTRFCANCGLSHENAAKLLTAGSVPVAYNEGKPKGQLSPRTKGILQGVALVPLLVGLDFILILIYDQFDVGVMDGAFATLTLILLLALMRILYAIFLEEGGSRRRNETLSYEWQREMPASMSQAALPESSTMFAARFEPRGRDTGEFIQPRSVVEHTTGRLGESR